MRAEEFLPTGTPPEFLPGLGFVKQERLSEELICGLTQLLPRVTAYLLPDVNRTISLMKRKKRLGTKKKTTNSEPRDYFIRRSPHFARRP